MSASEEDLCYITGSIQEDRNLAYNISVERLNKRELLPSKHWIPKRSINLKNKISPTLYIFKVDRWIYNKITHAMIGKVIFQKYVKLENKDLKNGKNYKISIPVLGEDKYTCCYYCKTEWLTNEDTGEVKFDHIRIKHPIQHMILISESEIDLIDILKSLPAEKLMSEYLGPILGMITSEDGLSEFIEYCSIKTLRDWVRKALEKQNSENRLLELKKKVDDKYIRQAIDDRLQSL